MHDLRINQLADLLLDHSCSIEKGERVLIEAFDLPDSDACVPADRRGGRTRSRAAGVLESNAVLRALYRSATEESMRVAGELESARMEKVQAYIGVRVRPIAVNLPTCRTRR